MELPKPDPNRLMTIKEKEEDEGSEEEFKGYQS